MAWRRTKGACCLALLLSSGLFISVSASAAKLEEMLEIKSALLRPCEKNLAYDCVKVDVRFNVDAPIETVWQVITDYQNAAQFISNLRSSTETSLATNSVQVEQVGRVGWGILNVDIRTVYKVSLNPIEKKIDSVSVGGDLQTVRMVTELKSKANGGTLLEYTLVTDPGPWAPLAITEELLKRQARQSFVDLRREILKRDNATLKR
jgi:carbon monoxide dehydrogenase subunit G